MVGSVNIVHYFLLNKTFSFKKWMKVNKILGNHACNTYHINAATDARAFLPILSEI